MACVRGHEQPVGLGESQGTPPPPHFPSLWEGSWLERKVPRTDYQVQ